MRIKGQCLVQDLDKRFWAKDIFHIFRNTVLHSSWKKHFGFQNLLGSDRNTLKPIRFNLISSNLWRCMESVFNMSKCGLTAIFAANAYTAADFCASVGINGILMQLNRIRGEHLREKIVSYSLIFFPVFSSKQNEDCRYSLN